MNKAMNEMRDEMQRALNEERAKQMEEGEWTEYDRGLAEGWVEALEYVLHQIDTRHRNNAEWFDNEPVVSKEANGRLYEVWANGLFSITSPEGDRFKGSNSATDWLVEHGVSNDADLEEVMDDESDWDLDASRWFDLIVFDIEMKDGIRHIQELYCGEPAFEYDEESFNEWIDEAIAQDSEDE